MKSLRITPNVAVADIEDAKAFYSGFLGLSEEEFNLGWVARFTDPVSGANIQLVTHDATSPVDSNMSIHADDVGAAYAEAVESG